MALRFVPLGSGSAGNSTLVEFGALRLLVDAGLSARALATRLAAVGVEPEKIDGILLSHEHGDHSRGAPRFSTKYGVPVICSPETLDALDLSPAHFARWVALPPDGRLDLGAVQVEAFPVPHDAVAPVGYILHGEGLHVGIATDLGHATTLVKQRLQGCHLMMLESNHDATMLRDGPYPWQLKQRVAGRLGHLSNHEAAALLKNAATDSCQAVVLAHLSRSNNTPELARSTVSRGLAAAGFTRIAMRVAMEGRPTPELLL